MGASLKILGGSVAAGHLDMPLLDILSICVFLSAW